MEIVNDNIYDYPDYYDLVYGSDWKAEVEFLTACMEKYCQMRSPELFEPACGTGRLVRRFAKAGYAISGLDLNEKAIAYCNAILKEERLPESTFVADMCDFKLPEAVDFTFNTINSFRHLPTGKLAMAHLDCMARNLSPGGIYVLGLHLLPTEGETTDSESWVASCDDLQVNTQMRLVRRDLKKRVEDYSMCFDVYTTEKFFQIQDTLSFRTYTAKQFCDMIDKCKGLEIVEAYDFAYDIDEPIQVGGETEDCVFILRKTDD